MKDRESFIKKLEESARAWDVSGVISLSEGEGRLYEGTFGWADRAGGRRMTLGETFCLDAESGIFLTLSIMDLAARGLLKLSHRVSRYIPEYPHGGEMTIRDLLRWRSGMEDYWRAIRLPRLELGEGVSGGERLRREYELFAGSGDFEGVLRDVAELELRPGHGRRADNSATTVPFLCEIIRRVSGLRPREYIFERFFGPLGMADTRPGNSATTALWAVMNDEELVPLPGLETEGAFTTTLRDMELFARALAARQFLLRALWDEMLRCDRDMMGMGFFLAGELYEADFFPFKLRDTCRIFISFEERVAITLLNNEEPKERLERGGRWRSFPGDLRRAWQDTRVYPKDPKLVPVGRNNVWDAMDIELRPEQLRFVPESSRCIAASLSRGEKAYVLMDHGVTVGLACLKIDPKKPEFTVTFLQVDCRYQHRGYGRILLSQALEVLKSRGAKTLEIGVNRFNIPAQRLYRSLGFKDSEIFDGFIGMKMTL